MLNQMFGKMYNAGKFDCERSFIFFKIVTDTNLFTLSERYLNQQDVK